jgi:hypothetical protein
LVFVVPVIVVAFPGIVVETLLVFNEVKPDSVDVNSVVVEVKATMVEV